MNVAGGARRIYAGLHTPLHPECSGQSLGKRVAQRPGIYELLSGQQLDHEMKGTHGDK